MAEAFVNVTEGSGKKLHAWDRVIGANTVLDEFVQPGEFPLPYYTLIAAGVSIATINDHLLCINAGASLNVRLRYLRIDQVANATAVLAGTMALIRTTTAAPTGGTALTPARHDNADAAAGATGRTLPTGKGTESTELRRETMIFRQGVSATVTNPEESLEWDYRDMKVKGPIIPAGTTNGLVVKNIIAVAGATVNIYAEFIETSFV